jgi:hypothetical protein
MWIIVAVAVVAVVLVWLVGSKARRKKKPDATYPFF